MVALCVGGKNRYDSPLCKKGGIGIIELMDLPHPNGWGQKWSSFMSNYFSKSLQRGVTWVAAAAIVTQPQLILAAEVNQPVVARSAAVAVAPQDVALADGGVLIGQVVDTAGKPQAMTPVSLSTGGKEIARVTTDAKGEFRVASLKGGVYQVSTKGNSSVYRFWAPQTAPPSSLSGLNMVSGDSVVRGQMGGGPLASAGQWIAEHPIITAGAIATAIAVPLALDDDDDNPPASP